MKSLKNIIKIIVHPGEVHYDEVIACAIARMFGAFAPIFRRNPTPEEMKDPNVLVLDVGGEYNSSRNNYDHHQIGRKEEVQCAYSLLCKGLGAYETFKKVFPWFESFKILDSKGPFALAKEVGTSFDKIEGILCDPLSSSIIKIFKDELDDEIQFRVDFLLSVISDFMEKSVEAYEKGMKQVNKIFLKGMWIADFRNVDPNYKGSITDIYIRETPEVRCLIDFDNRGNGLSFLRINDFERLDFSQCKEKDYCLFAHNGGFILKTKDREVDIDQVLQDAYK